VPFPATDDFTDPNGTPLPAHNPGWTEVIGSFDIQTNAARCDGVGALFTGVAGWSAQTFDDDQYSEATVVAIGGIGVGISARCNVDGVESYYLYWSTAVRSDISRAVNGAWLNLTPDPGGPAFQVGDTISIT
jgi:hypothetical protein